MGQTMAKSTVVIPNYNGIKYIEVCLESVYGGTVKDVDVIVVDNGSTDGSMELVRDKFPKVKLIVNNENTGFSHAVNQGIKSSKTPYVILLNNDTRVELDFIHELEKIMDGDKRQRLFSASAKMVSLNDKEKIDDAGDYYCALGWAFARGKGKSPDKYNNECNVFSSCAGAAIYRRELFEDDKVGLFDEEHFAYFEDVDIGHRAMIKGYKNKFAAGAVVYHAGSATSGSRYNTFKIKLASRNSVYIIYKNMPIWQIIINLPFLILGFLVKTLFFIKKGMGKEYVFGLIDGFKLSKSNEGKKHRQKFDLKNFPRCIYVQFLLWINMFRLFA
jgi:hypothetical protein